MSICKSLGVTMTVLVGMTTFAAPAVAQDLEFTLINKTSFDVVAFYASPKGVSNWEEDILGSELLESRDSIQITIADGRSQCAYDLRFEFDDGDTVERSGVDLCETGSYTLTE